MPNFAKVSLTTDAQHIDQALVQHGWAIVDQDALTAATGTTPAALQALAPSWETLPCDPHLKDGGRYRRRRHASMICDAQGLHPVAHRPHWQPVEYNALHGGMERLFDPIMPEVLQSPALTHLVTGLGQIFTRASGQPTWYVEAHQFRIDTTDGIGRPTPEGAHRDGVDFVAVIMVQRVGIKGGETRVFDAHGPQGMRLTLTEPWSAILLNDAEVIHETTPLQPLDDMGWRDTLVLTYRADGFQQARPLA